MVRRWMAALALSLSLSFGMCPQEAHAQAVFVPSTTRTDMVHDARRGIIYIANGPQVRRYRISTRSFLPALTLGIDAMAMGIDISADGSTLAVADASWSADKVWIHKINLNTLAKTRWRFPRAFYEGGTYSVAFAADNAVLVSSSFQGSGWVPMRRLERNGTYTTLPEVRQNTMLSASGDRATIAFAEANSSDGPWGLFDVPTGQLVRREGYEHGTSWSNFEIATDRLGGQFAIPTYNGAYIYGADYRLLDTIGTYAGPQPVGVAYHPVEPEIYFPWAETSQVQVWSATTLQHLRNIEVGDGFAHTGNTAYGSGRTRLSADGSLLMVTVPGGLRYVRQYAPLDAADVQASVATGVASAIQLAGSIGNHGRLAYSIHQPPQHGTARVYGSRVSYRPAAGYTGTDRFVYLVRYGEAVVAARVDITVE